VSSVGTFLISHNASKYYSLLLALELPKSRYFRTIFSLFVLRDKEASSWTHGNWQEAWGDSSGRQLLGNVGIPESATKLENLR
jgi:hypothetical protein